MRLQDARARMYHDLIFESAEYVFGAQGFEHATMQEIAQEAGVSLKTLYATFPGKLELYDEIHRVRSTALVAQVAAAIEAAEGPLECILAAARVNVEFLWEHQDWFQMHLQDRVSWGFEPKAADAATLWKQALSRSVDFLREGMEQGVFHPEDPWALARMLQSILQVQVARALESGEEDGAKVVEQALTSMRRLLCRSDPQAPARAIA